MKPRLIAVAFLVSTPLAAQLPTIRPAPPPVASRSGFGSLTAVRQLSDGRLLINDDGAKRLALVDSNLKDISVILDASLAGQRNYPRSTGGTTLLPFTADSSLVFDAASSSLTVIDPAGSQGRVFAIPRPSDGAYVDPTFGVPALDPHGRLVYWIPLPGRAYPDIWRDSGAVVRADFDTRLADTLLRVARARPPVRSAVTVREGKMYGTTYLPPFDVTDGWGMTSDGTVGVIRARDYHVDWIDLDGNRTSSPRVPWPWHRMTDADRDHIRDSLVVEYKRLDSLGIANAPKNVNLVYNTRVPPPFAEWPDYATPFVAKSVRADNCNHLWVREIPVDNLPGVIYDVIGRSGAIVDRIQFAAGRSVLGFGQCGTVYLTSGTTGAMRLERSVVPLR